MERTFKNGARCIEILENGIAIGTIRVTCGKQATYWAHVYGTGNAQHQFKSEDEAKNFLLQSAENKKVATYDTSSQKKNFSFWGW